MVEDTVWPQIQSGGLLRATPHYVRAPGSAAAGVSRNTFAVFMQPKCGAALSHKDQQLGVMLLLARNGGAASCNTGHGRTIPRSSNDDF